jgi:biopolymer transport protein ExbD
MNLLTAITLLFAIGACECARPRATPIEVKPPSGECIVKIAIQGDRIAYDGGSLQGETPKAAPDLSALRRVEGTCSIRVTAPDATPYRDVIAVMEAVHRLGVQATIGEGPRTALKRPPSVAPPAPGDPRPEQEEATELLFIAVGTSGVEIQGKSIGASPHAPGLGDKILTELAKGLATVDANVVLEIDPSLPFVAVRQTIEAVEASGYTRLAFAVRP